MFSCSGHSVRGDLARADGYMMSHPDSALLILDHMDTSRIASKRNRARYALLHTMAIDRNYIDTTDLSVLKNAVDYYQRHGRAKERMRTFYYQGRILFNRRDYPSAVVAFSKSLDYSDNIDDDWMKGMICSLLSSTYNYNYNKADELKYAKYALDFFEKYGDDLYIDNARFGLALAYHNNRLFSPSDSLYRIIITNPQYKIFAITGLANNAINENPLRPQDAVKNFEKAVSLGATLSANDMYRYAYALILDGKRERADNILNRAAGIPVDVGTYWWKYCIAKEKQDYAGALELYEYYSSQRDSLINALLAQSLYRAESEHYAAEAQATKHQSERLSFILVFVLSSSCLLLLVFVFYWQNRKIQERLVRNELEQKIADAQALVDIASQKSERFREEEEKLVNLRSSFASMYQSQFARIGNLVNSNLDISIHLIDESIKKAFSDIYSEISSGVKQQRKFEARINADLDNIITKIRADFPSFDDDTIRLLCYVIVGFKDSAIATILNENNSTIRTRKSRLKKTILETPTENIDLYRAFL